MSDPLGAERIRFDRRDAVREARQKSGMLMGRLLLSLFRRDDGVVAVIFAVMAIPFIAMGGWAVDYLRIQHVKEYLQIQVDSAALNSFVEHGRTADQQWALVEAATLGEISRQYQGNWARQVTLNHQYLSDANDMIEVQASADVPVAFIHLLPGIPETQRVSVSAVAQFFAAREVREPPNTSLLDPEAGDFNRIWAYCYWPNRWEHSELPKRTRMVPIADNGGSTFTPNFDLPPNSAALAPIYAARNGSNILGLDGVEEGVWKMTKGGGNNQRTYEYMWPACQEGSFLSFRLENVRFSRTQPNYWDANNAAPNGGGDRITGRFNYYTDTYFEIGSTEEKYDGLYGPSQYTNGPQKVNILETVLCNSLAECRPASQGGVIPDQRPREPQRATGQCEPGKYMYYGWEDRPPGLLGQSRNWQDIAWTDRDYDDIRIIIKCPTFETVGERNSRLVR
ncbi:TadE/TadG family type IV pilus assembly protein [Pelagibacterium luteolum]|uniref:Putative Flp pilus-assembly TadE/G-like n=1 Tax=Pelagibacterium luteolum TaxID=440168 RepID=A0A1G8A4Z1_9HYPH|nr:Tad domain-containing protein [Pelagibacterium luteolum]SDH15470.1 Putative Flp pilus-assembly TadE/G-like [Pelagibacterium luteolum]